MDKKLKAKAADLEKATSMCWDDLLLYAQGSIPAEWLNFEIIICDKMKSAIVHLDPILAELMVAELEKDTILYGEIYKDFTFEKSIVVIKGNVEINLVWLQNLIVRIFNRTRVESYADVICEHMEKQKKWIEKEACSLLDSNVKLKVWIDKKRFLFIAQISLKKKGKRGTKKFNFSNASAEVLLLAIKKKLKK